MIRDLKSKEACGSCEAVYPAACLCTVVLPTNQNLVWDSKTHAVSFMMSKLAEGNFCFLSCRISKPKRCYLTRPSGCEIYETDLFNYYSTWQTIVPPLTDATIVKSDL